MLKLILYKKFACARDVQDIIRGFYMKYRSASPLPGEYIFLRQHWMLGNRSKQVFSKVFSATGIVSDSLAAGKIFI